MSMWLIFFFFNDTATTEIYTLSLHDALPILALGEVETLAGQLSSYHLFHATRAELLTMVGRHREAAEANRRDRKSTRLNSSHANISYAVFCFKKKKKKT